MLTAIAHTMACESRKPVVITVRQPGRNIAGVPFLAHILAVVWP